MKLGIPRGLYWPLGLLGAWTLVMMPVTHDVRGRAHQRVPVPYDWSHNHVRFSSPATQAQARKLQREARYTHELLRRNPPNGAAKNLRDESGQVMRDPDDGESKNPRDDSGRMLRHVPIPKRRQTVGQMHTDWAFSMSALGAGPSGAGSAVTYPAKFSFDVTATPDCVNDYVAFNTSLAGSAGTPNVIALNQLYTSQAGGLPAGFCGTTGPSVMWSYFTGTGQVQTSIALSLLGDKVAFVETSAGGGAVLRILRGVAGEGTTITSPQTPTNSFVNTTVGAGGNTAWNTTNCPDGQSCMISVPFQNGNQDTNSSPFYDFGSDTIYVGDDNGVLHSFTGVFLGTPAEVTTGNWPVTVNPGTILTSPAVDDISSGNVFVGDSGGTVWYVRLGAGSFGSCAMAGTPPCVGATSIALTGSIVDGPLVDVTTGHVFWFDGTDTTNNGEVVQTDTVLGNAVTLAGVGGTAAGSPMFNGAFDNTYLTSAANNVSGFLYFCGKNPTQTNASALWRVGFNSTGVMNSTPDGGATGFISLVNGPTQQCSAVTEIFNTSTSKDWIFFSVAANNSACNGNGSCVMSFDLGTITTWPPPNGRLALAAASDLSVGGTSGIIIDNVAPVTAGNFPQASSLYFSWLGPAGPTPPGGIGAGYQCNSATSGGCFQKLTQNGLQ